MECVQEIKKGALDFDITRFAEKYIPSVLRFWSKVSIEELDQCWSWTGPTISRRVAFTWPRKTLHSNYRFHPIRIVMWLTFGDVGRMGSHTACGNRRCCNPLHNLPSELFNPSDFGKFDVKSLSERVEFLKSQIREADRSKESVELKRIESSKQIITQDPSVTRLICSEEATETLMSGYGYAYQEALKEYDRRCLQIFKASSHDSKALSRQQSIKVK